MITLSNITLARHETTVLQDFGLAIPKASLTILLGSGGSGKTTICDLLVGKLAPDRGTAARDIQSNQIGLVSQSLPLLDDRSIAENIELPLELSGVRAARRKQQVQELLERFELTSLSEKRPQMVSMSERACAAIARAVATEPFLLIADEPAAHLDWNTASGIATLLEREHFRGMTLFITTSDERFASLFFGATLVHLDRNTMVNNY
jgi:ABC-type ATPase involved in cell division